jgi:hypothetical protein
MVLAVMPEHHSGFDKDASYRNGPVEEPMD